MINPESLVIRQGFAEPSLKDAVAGKTFRFEREGYFCLDSRHSTAEKPVFNRTVGLRDTWAKVGGKFTLSDEAFTPHPARNMQIIPNAALCGVFFCFLRELIPLRNLSIK